MEKLRQEALNLELINNETNAKLAETDAKLDNANARLADANAKLN